MRPERTTNKSTLNLIVDILLWIVFAAVSGIGILIKYALPSGYARRHDGIRSSVSQWWGMGRHEWGEIHWILSLLLLVLLLLHILLHRKMIGGMLRKAFPNPALRYLLSALLLGFATVCLLVPLLL